MKTPKTIEAAQRAEITKEIKQLSREREKLKRQNVSLLGAERRDVEKLVVRRDRMIAAANREYTRNAMLRCKTTQKTLNGNRRQIDTIEKRVAILEGRLS